VEFLTKIFFTSRFERVRHYESVSNSTTLSKRLFLVTMSILKKNPKFRFTQISNHLIEDENLSHPEFRLMCYLLSRPPNWKINNMDVMKRLQIKSRGTLGSYWKSVIKNGYLKRQESKKVGGKFAGYDYQITEKCYSPCTVKPDTVQTDADESMYEQDRDGANDPLINTDSFNNKDSNKIQEITDTEESSDFQKKSDLSERVIFLLIEINKIVGFRSQVSNLLSVF